MCKESFKNLGLDNKVMLCCKNMFVFGLVCWLFNCNLFVVEKMLNEKFVKKLEIVVVNIKVLNDGYNYGVNIYVFIFIYKIESKMLKVVGFYIDINGNKVILYGLIVVVEKVGLEFYLGFYFIILVIDILYEFVKYKLLGVKIV